MSERKVKKRGRKPKGGKILHHSLHDEKKKEIPKNIVVHLKCSTDDIKNVSFLSEMKYEPNICNVQAYESLDNTYYIDVSDKEKTIVEEVPLQEEFKDVEKIINDKVKQLQNQFHLNVVSTKESACFWCTCSFDNPAIYIPSNYENNSYEVYGCFCTPQCAVSYLKKQKIDTSTLWERYSLLNNMYTKIYDYKRDRKSTRLNSSH